MIEEVTCKQYKNFKNDLFFQKKLDKINYVEYN